MGEVARALAEGRIIKTFAFRGATHLLTPEEGGAYLALRGASRMWELPSWQDYYSLTPSDWPLLRETVREALADGPLTRDELGAAVTARPKFRHLGSAFTDGADTLLKPLAWQGDMSFGPPRDGRATFQRLDGNPRWAGIPDLEEAGLRAVEAYVAAYGPTTPDHVHYWLGEGLSAGRKRLETWFSELGDRLVPVDIEGTSAYVVREEVDALVLTKEDQDGRLIVSKKRARFEKAWRRIEAAAESGEPVEGHVIEVVKGGLIIDLGVRGFLPASLVDIRRVQEWMGHADVQIGAISADCGALRRAGGDVAAATTESVAEPSRHNCTQLVQRRLSMQDEVE